TGLPVILRDAQVLSIWEGTTNVLSLDALRTATREDGALASLKAEVESCARSVRDARLARAAAVAREAIEHAAIWLAGTREGSQTTLEAGARRFALTLGRATAAALLARHAQWSLDEERDARTSASARRFALSGVDLIADVDGEDSFALMNDS